MRNKKSNGQRDFNLWNLIGNFSVSISNQEIKGQSLLDEKLSKNERKYGPEFKERWIILIIKFEIAEIFI